MPVYFKIEAPAIEITGALERYRLAIERSATIAMQDTIDDAKRRGRANIASAGFSQKWQNGLRGKVFPERDMSANPAGIIYHKFSYFDVFETGATIRPKSAKWLWVPLPSTPQYLGRERTTPSLWEKRRGDLQFINTGSRPLLFAKRRKGSGATLYDRRPLFVGLRNVRIEKRFSVTSAILQAADLYAPRFLTYLNYEISGDGI